MTTPFRWLLGALALVALLLVEARPAYACSVGPEFDPIRESDLVVAGRLVRWEPLPRAGENPFTPVQVDMTVDEVFKGDAGETVQFVDRASLLGDSANQTWQGSSGACGAFNDDPAGQYAIVGLSKTEDGTYSSTSLMVFFIGPEPAGDLYTQALSRVVGAIGTAPTVGPTSVPAATEAAQAASPEPGATETVAAPEPTIEPAGSQPTPVTTVTAPAGEARAGGTMPAVLLAGLVAAGLAGFFLLRGRNGRRD